jgi:hypothetical protein
MYDFSLSQIGTVGSALLSDLAPALTVLVGISIAFSVLGFLVERFGKKKEEAKGGE